MVRPGGGRLRDSPPNGAAAPLPSPIGRSRRPRLRAPLALLKRGEIDSVALAVEAYAQGGFMRLMAPRTARNGARRRRVDRRRSVHLCSGHNRFGGGAGLRSNAKLSLLQIRPGQRPDNSGRPAVESAPIRRAVSAKFPTSSGDKFRSRMARSRYDSHFLSAW